MKIEFYMPETTVKKFCKGDSEAVKAFQEIVTSCLFEYVVKRDDLTASIKVGVKNIDFEEFEIGESSEVVDYKTIAILKLVEGRLADNAGYLIKELEKRGVEVSELNHLLFFYNTIIEGCINDLNGVSTRKRHDLYDKKLERLKKSKGYQFVKWGEKI